MLREKGLIKLMIVINKALFVYASLQKLNI